MNRRAGSLPGSPYPHQAVFAVPRGTQRGRGRTSQRKAVRARGFGTVAQLRPLQQPWAPAARDVFHVEQTPPARPRSGLPSSEAVTIEKPQQSPAAAARCASTRAGSASETHGFALKVRVFGVRHDGLTGSSTAATRPVDLCPFHVEHPAWTRTLSEQRALRRYTDAAWVFGWAKALLK